MSYKNIDVFITNLPEMEESIYDLHLVSLPKSYYKQLQCSTGKLKIGQKEIKATFVCNPSDNQIGFSDALMKKTGLSKGTKVSILIDGKTLRLGPLIGVLTSQRYIHKLNKQQPSFRTLELWQAN